MGERVMLNRSSSVFLSVALAASLSSIEAEAGEKIVFSGRDGQKVQYHRSLNARPLFAPTTLQASKGSGGSATDDIFAAPSMLLRRDRAELDDEDKDWAFKSTDELVDDQIGNDMDELTEDMRELEEAGRKRTQVEKFLDRRREDRGEKAPHDSRTDGRTPSNREAGNRESAAAARERLQGTPPGGAGFQPVKPGPASAASSSRTTAGAGRSVLVAPRADTAMSPKAFMEFQREHVAQLKQTFGVAGSAAAPPASAAGTSQTGALAGQSNSAQKASPLNGPAPGNTGVYPGLQGRGISDLTTPAGAQNGITPLQPRSAQQPERSRQRNRSMRFEAPKRNVF